MATNTAYLQIASSNAYQFASASNNDFVFYGTNASQQLLIGSTKNTPANLTLTPSNIDFTVLGNTSNSSIVFNTNNTTTNELQVLGNGFVGVGIPAYNAPKIAALLTVADYDGSLDPIQYGLVQLHHQANGAAGKSNQASIAFVRTNNFVSGLGFGKNNNNFGFGFAYTSNSDFNPNQMSFSNGCVGVGNASPSFPLDINGSTRLSGPSNANPTNKGPHIYTYTSDDSTRPRMGFQTNSIDNQSITFDSYYTGSNDAYSSSNVASYSLNKYQNQLVLRCLGAGAQGATVTPVVGLSINSNAYVGIATSNATQALTIGNGATDSNSLLHINTSDGDKILMTAVGLSNGSKITHSAGWSFNLVAGQSNSIGGNTIFQTGTASGYAERVRVASSGNVGIGSTNPQQALDVVGNGNFTGNIIAGNLGMFRNRIINGDMRFAQRNTTATINPSTAFQFLTVDRWGIGFSITTGALTITQQTLASTDTPFSYGLKYSWRIAASTACTNYAYINNIQRIEGNNTADLNWGTTAGTSATLSFWFRTNAATGSVVSAAIRNGLNNYSYVVPVTVASTAAWQYASVVIPAPPNGTTWYTDTQNGIDVSICNGSSGTYATSSPNTWVSGNYIRSTTSSDVFATINNYVEFTGVQFEKGTLATQFEFRPYAVELKLCQRYYEKSFPQGTVPVAGYSNEYAVINNNNTTANSGTYTSGGLPFKTQKRIDGATCYFYNPFNSGAAVNTNLRVLGGTTDVTLQGVAAVSHSITTVMATASATPYAHAINYVVDAEI